MYQKLMHNKSLRLIGGLLGGLLLSVAINVFIVPQGLYGGGAYGLCQVIRTLLQRELSLSLPFDLAGVLYFFVNIPLFLLAYKALGREFFWKAAICTVCNSVFLAVIPSPSTPVIPDLLTSCMVGGILAGFASGLVLTCGCSTGGLDILGKVLNKYLHVELGKSIAFIGAITVALSLFVYDTKTLVVGFLGTYFNGIVLDEFISGFSKRKRVCILSEQHEKLADYIMHDISRGVTLYEAKGGYDNKPKVEIVTILAKNEYALLMEYFRKNDPKAFVTVSTVSEVVGYWNVNKLRF